MTSPIGVMFAALAVMAGIAVAMTVLTVWILRRDDPRPPPPPGVQADDPRPVPPPAITDVPAQSPYDPGKWRAYVNGAA